MNSGQQTSVQQVGIQLTQNGFSSEGQPASQEYDLLKIRRRCEEAMRKMDDPELLISIAKQLKVKLF